MPTNSINQDQEYAYLPSEFMSLSYWTSDGTFVNIPGIQSVDLGPTAAPIRDVIGANAAPQARMGRPRVPRVTANALALPTDVAWRALRDAQNDRTTLTFRFETNGEAVFTSATTNGATAQVSSAGALTFNQGASNGQAAPTVAGSYGLGRGAVVKIGTNWLMISSVSNASTPVINVVSIDTWAAPASQIAAGSCVIYNPAPHRYEFTAQVAEGAADLSLSEESEATTTLTLVPRKAPTLPTIIKV